MQDSISDHWCWDIARERFAEWDAERKGEELTVSAKTHSVESMISRIMAGSGMILGTTTKSDLDSNLPIGEPFNGVGAISIPGWRVFNETEGAFRKRAVQQLKQELEGHIERARVAARDHDAITTTAKGASLDKHLIWLARVVVKGERAAEVWKSLGKPGFRVRAGRKNVPIRSGFTRRAVEKAIRDTAKLIGLTVPKA